jgi:hypothetical protein
VKSPIRRSTGLVAASLPLLLAANAAPALEGYPTLERTAYVMHCMGEHGGQTMDNLYSCACLVDKVMRELTLEEYNEIQTFIQYKRMPGDKGGIFRDQPRAEDLLAKQEELEAAAHKACFIQHKEVKPKPGEKAPTPTAPEAAAS